MNLWKAISLSWQTSPVLYRLLWIIVLIIYAIEAMAAACVGMAYGPSLIQVDMGFTAVLLFFATHLMVSAGIKKGTLGERTLLKQQPMTTDRAEDVLAEFTCFRGPLTAAWVHRWAHGVGLALVVSAYVLFTVRDVSHWPLGVLIVLALVLSALSSYLLLLLAINYAWAKIVRDLRKISRRSGQ